MKQIIYLTTMFSFSSLQSLKSFSSNKSAFTLTELIVVITILSILSVIGFVVMSHQSSVARDGKRISDIQTLSQSAKITSAQLRKLPTPIADSVSLSVSGTFIGYQGFMSTSIVNPLGYGSDKIFDPKDNIPYTYRVNQYYDSAQFMAYLENPRFERTIEIAKQSLPSTLPSLFSQAYALDSSTTDLSSRYPYSAGDRLGIFVSKGSNQPLQNGVTGTGSRDISLSDASTLDIIVGSQGADEYVSTDISTGALSSLKDGSFDEKSLLGMNGGTSGSGSGGGDSGGGGLPVSHILTMGEYSVMGNTYYGYIGPITISLYATFGVTITTVTPGSLIDDTVDGHVIDSVFANSTFSAWQTILAGSTNMPSNVAFETPYANLNCTNLGVIDSLTMYSCTGSTVSTDFYVGSQHDLGITFPAAIIPPPNTPIGLAVTLGDSEVTVGWNPVNTATSYTLAWSIGSGAYTEIPGLTGTGYLHTGLTNGATYNYKIKAVNNDGESSYSSVVSTIPDVPPEVPTNFSATGIIANSITLSWDAIADGQSGFNIEYSTDGVNFTDVGDFSGGGGARQYAHNGLVEGATYYYRIRATKSYGVVSAWSDVVSSVVIGTPLLPTPNNITNAPLNTDIISDVVTASNISTPVPLSVSGAELRVNGGSWVTSVNISNGDQVEYKTTVTQDGERKIVTINFNGENSQWTVDAYSCFIFSNSTITGYQCLETTVIIPSKLFNQPVASIGGAFYGKWWITSVVIPDSVTSIGNYAFYNVGITSIIIPDSVTSIGNYAFSTNNSLTSVTIPNSVLTIGARAFYQTSLTSVTLGNSVISIGWQAFAWTLLTSVTIPNSVLTIEDAAFYANNLTSVTLGNSVISIGSQAFTTNGYSTIASIIIPDSVISIGYGAFSSNNISTLILGNNVTSIGAFAFYGNSFTSITIPNSVTSIGDYAFSVTHLTSVIIPDSVMSIGSYAFSTNQLTSLVIGNSVTSIGEYAFAGNRLTSVTIPNSVTSIGGGAFQGNRLTSVTIPNSVTSIGDSAFWNQINSVGNGIVYGPTSGYVKDTYSTNSNSQFDKVKLPNYVDTP